MTPVLAVPMLAALLIGCTDGDDGSSFGGGGSSSVGNDDTGSADSGDGGSETDPSAPTITSVEAAFYSPPNLPQVIEVYIYWDDVEGDVDGGKVQLTISASDGESLSDTLDIDGKFARLDEDISGSPVWFWVSGADGGAVDDSLTYTLELKLKDAEGNASATTTVDVP